MTVITEFSIAARAMVTTNVTSGAHLPSPAQKRYLRLIATRGYSKSAHLFLAWTLAGDLCISRLDKSIRNVLLRHDSLRTTFACVATGAPQAVVLDAPAAPALRPAQHMREPITLEQWRDRPFDISGGQLHRAALLPDGQGRTVLAFAFHHLIIDGESLPIFIRSLNTAYQHGSLTSAEREATYRMYAESQARSSLSLKGKRALRFWGDTLRDLPSIQLLPFERTQARRTAPSHAVTASSTTLGLSVEQTKRLCVCASSFAVTPFTLSLGVFFRVLMQTTGAPDHTVVVPIDGRPSSVKFKNTIGLFVNPLPIRLIGAKHASTLEVLGRLAPLMLDVLRFRFTAYGDVCRVAGGPEITAKSPLRRIFARYDSSAMSHPDLRIDGVITEWLPQHEAMGSTHDLELLVCLRNGLIDLRFSSNGSLTPDELNELSALYADVLNHVLSIRSH